MKYEYQIVNKSSAIEATEAMRRLGRDGYKMVSFEYREYPHNVKGEGTSIMQSYVAIMERSNDFTEAVV